MWSNHDPVPARFFDPDEDDDLARKTPSVSTLALKYVAERTRRRELTGESPKTHRHILVAFASAIGNPQAHTLTRRHVEKWRNSQNVAASTARNRFSVIKVFCEWLIVNGYLQKDPTLGITPPKSPRAIPRALPAASVAKVLDSVPDARGRFIALLMVQEGLRCIEVSNLQAGDFDDVNGYVRVKGKGGHERVLPLSDETIAAFRAYAAEHPLIAGPLVRSYDNPHKALSPGYLGDRMRLWMSRAGVKRYARDGVSAHALRHTAATDALDNGANAREVQEMLGHQSLATTQRYLKVRPESLRRAMGGRRYLNGGAELGDAS